MSRSRHTEAQMIGALKQLEAGRKAEDVARDLSKTHLAQAGSRDPAIQGGLVPFALHDSCETMDVDAFASVRCTRA